MRDVQIKTTNDGFVFQFKHPAASAEKELCLLMVAHNLAHHNDGKMGCLRRGASQTRHGFRLFLSRMHFRPVNKPTTASVSGIRSCLHYVTPLLMVAAPLNMQKLRLNRSNPLSSSRNVPSASTPFYLPPSSSCAFRSQNCVCFSDSSSDLRERH